MAAFPNITPKLCKTGMKLHEASALASADEHEALYSSDNLSCWPFFSGVLCTTLLGCNRGPLPLHPLQLFPLPLL